MSVLQSTYSDDPAIAVAGVIANGETGNRISRTIEGSGGVGFGKAVYRGSGDHGCLAVQTLTGTATADAGNAGDGTCSAVVVTEEEGAKPGVYNVIFTGKDTNAGAFTVTDPDGQVVDTGDAGTEFDAGGLTFTISDGATDFDEGDRFTITVAGNPFLGISIATTGIGLVSGQTADTYAQYDNVPILTMGAIFVEAGETVVDGGQVYVDADGNFVDSVGIPCPGWIFDMSGSDGDIVRIVKR